MRARVAKGQQSEHTPGSEERHTQPRPHVRIALNVCHSCSVPVSARSTAALVARICIRNRLSAASSVAGHFGGRRLDSECCISRARNRWVSVSTSKTRADSQGISFRSDCSKVSRTSSMLRFWVRARVVLRKASASAEADSARGQISRHLFFGRFSRRNILRGSHQPAHESGCVPHREAVNRHPAHRAIGPDNPKFFVDLAGRRRLRETRQDANFVLGGETAPDRTRDYLEAYSGTVR
jgi:hypothetical protein